MVGKYVVRVIISSLLLGSAASAQSSADPSEKIWERYGMLPAKFAPISLYVGGSVDSDEITHRMGCGFGWKKSTDQISRSELREILIKAAKYHRVHLENAQETDSISIKDLPTKVSFRGEVTPLDNYLYPKNRLISNFTIYDKGSFDIDTIDEAFICGFEFIEKTPVDYLISDAKFDAAVEKLKEKIRARKDFIERDPYEGL